MRELAEILVALLRMRERLATASSTFTRSGSSSAATWASPLDAAMIALARRC